MIEPGGDAAVPLRFDLQDLVRRSVATLYSHLVTRPTGRALRLGIESQIEELGSLCLSILDFRQVVVLDYSCADETVAKLLQRFLADDRPAEAYFLARGVGETHLEPLVEVLRRHRLALVAELEAGDVTLLGTADEMERAAWAALERLRRADAAEVARCLGVAPAVVAPALESLAGRRLAVRRRGVPVYLALTALLSDGA